MTSAAVHREALRLADKDLAEALKRIEAARARVAAATAKYDERIGKRRTAGS